MFVMLKVLNRDYKQSISSMESEFYGKLLVVLDDDLGVCGYLIAVSESYESHEELIQLRDTQFKDKRTMIAGSYYPTKKFLQALAGEETYTTEDIYALPDGQRAELIDGQMYMMAPPRRIHQELITELVSVIHRHIKDHNGGCKVYPAPFAVFLNADDKNYVEPDISVICDRDKLNEYGCKGAPDWVIEVISPGTERMDYGIKLFKYRSAGVREYWIVNPSTRTVNVYDFENNAETTQYAFEDEISVCIYKDLNIRLSEFV